MKVLIVRLGALGDIVHAIPAAAAIRAAWPEARIDWLVDAKHRAMVDLVACVDRCIPLERPSPGGWRDAIRILRREHYDWAIDVQGLLKSAVLARASGAARVAGFSRGLRERAARLFYTDVPAGPAAPAGEHVIARNLGLLRTLGIDDQRVTFPLRQVTSPALDVVRGGPAGDRPFALINAGAAWPNKRWPAAGYGNVAAYLHDVQSMRPFVLWGPGETAAAQAVVDASGGKASLAPPTTVADIFALCREAGIVVSGDTGPLHIATAAGAPTVSLFGPTDPDRNGPFDPVDVVVSRFGSCGCPYQRRCHRRDWCLGGVPASEVTLAIRRRLES